MVLKCDCKHEYQDSKYGAGMRVHNQTKNGYRCVVCGKTKEKTKKQIEDEKVGK